MPKRLWSRRASEIGLLVVVLLLTAVAISPLLRADQPCTHDGGLHYYRVVAMRHALDDGLLVSRWVPDLAFGYGFPFFNYRAAVSYYLGLGLHLTGLSLPQALNAVYILSLIISAIGAYLLGRDLFGRRAGLVAAVAYVYAPYLVIDALVRGNMPESVGLALLPFILWAFRRLLLSGRTRYLLTSGGLLALLWLSHNISSLLFTPFLALYLPLVWLARGRRDHLLMAGVALALGIGLTAFFWAPAVLEKDDVQLYLSRTARNNDFHFNFLNLSEMFAPPQSADPALLNPPLRLPLGLPLVTLALMGTALGLRRWRGSIAKTTGSYGGPEEADDLSHDTENISERERWVSVAFFALMGIATIFMATRASVALWERLPLISFVQFPWRFVGRAVLPLSLLAAAFVAALSQYASRAAKRWELERRTAKNVRHLSAFAVPSIVAILVLTALPSTYPVTGYCPAKPRPNILDLFAYERSTGLVGVDPLGSYFPVTVQARPNASPLEAQYAAALAEPDRADRIPIARFDSQGLPVGAVLHQAEYEPNQARLEIETPDSFRARYLAFAFPGWRVLIDDHPVDIIPSDPEGFITFELPAGRHTVEISWGSTPVRAVATMLSLASLAGLAIIAFSAMRTHLTQRIKAGRTPAPGEPFRPAGAFTWGHVGMLTALAVLLLAFKLAVVDRRDTLFRRPGLSDAGTLAGLDVPLDVPFDDGVRLLGYDRSTETMPADGVLHLAFYWSAYARPGRSYRATVALRGPDGQLWSPKTALPSRGYSDMPPSPAWGEGRYAVDGLDVEPLPGTPPGRYELLLTAFDRETLAPLNVLNEAGQVVGPDLIVGQVRLTKPSRTPDAADVAMQTHLASKLGPLTLAGANLDRAEAVPGDPMMVTLFWRLEGGGALPDLRLHLGLLGEGGAEAMGWELPPVRADWPTAQWEPGDLWRGQHLLRLPGRLESGTYTWQLSLYDATNPQSRLPGSSVDLGQLQVNAPERLWVAPPPELSLDAELGGVATLVGANLAPASAGGLTLQPSATLSVTLIWQARAEMETSYRVFLHLLRADGELLTQSDGEPVNWSRPTTGWAPGELIVDERVLEVPADSAPGQYTLVAGLYDPDTGDRLPLPDGSGAVVIVPVAIEQP